MRAPIDRSQLKAGMMFVADGGPVMFVSRTPPANTAPRPPDPFAEQKRLLALGEAKLKEIKAVLAARKRA